MVFDSIFSLLVSAENALLVTFGRTFDYLFGLNWASGDSFLWGLAAVGILYLLFV